LSKRVRSIALLFAVTALALTACSNDEPSVTGGGGSPTSSPSGSPSGTPVAVTLQEYAVLPAVTSAPAGAITFTATNKGPMKDHEFVVVRTSLTPDKLPTSADGSVDEEGSGIEAIGEIGEFPVGQSKSVTFTLTPGSYVLFCNVVAKEGSETLVHYKLGMRTAFTVS
jgi:hypothetical protein